MFLLKKLTRLLSNDDKRIQSIDLMETYTYGMDKDLVCKKEEIKCNNIIQQKMFNFDYITKEDIKEHNQNWPEIPDHSYRVLIVEGSGFRKTSPLLNLINNEPDIEKIYMLKIHMKQNINYYLTKEKVQA